MLPGRNGKTLEAAYSGRDNAFNLMRLCFALMVIVGHAGVIGWGPGHEPFAIPVDLGGIAVTGFFALSGFLISRSGRRSGPVRYVWHRVLRIFPGYWVCLIATAFVLAPLLFWYEHGTLHMFRHTGSGPLAYVYHNFLTDQLQPDVSRVISTAEYPYSLNGSLWTLKSELTCYLLVLFLAVIAVLRRARWVVLVIGAGLFGAVVWETVVGMAHAGRLNPAAPAVSVPVLGLFLLFYLLVFGVAFVLGMIADLYRPVIPINDVLGVIAVACWVASLRLGWPLFGPAIVPFVYMLLWLGVRIPSALRRIGRKNDYSYGVYIYAFPVQQALSIFGLPRYGVWVYLGTTFVTVLAVAMLSWHLVEKPAMRLKDWSPPFARRRATAEVPNPDVPSAAHPAPVLVPAPRSAPAPVPSADAPFVPTPRTAEADALEPHDR
jgi:peptidoglycan/LPS O-acetylase OafA/YrhL